MAKTYTVKQGDTIQDVAFQRVRLSRGHRPDIGEKHAHEYPARGLEGHAVPPGPPAKNFMESYTPALRANQILDVEEIDIYNLQTLQRHPFNSSMDVKEEVEAEISRLFKATVREDAPSYRRLRPRLWGR